MKVHPRCSWAGSQRGRHQAINPSFCARTGPLPHRLSHSHSHSRLPGSESAAAAAGPHPSAAAAAPRPRRRPAAHRAQAPGQASLPLPPRPLLVPLLPLLLALLLLLLALLLAAGGGGGRPRRRSLLRARHPPRPHPDSLGSLWPSGWRQLAPCSHRAWHRSGASAGRGWVGGWELGSAGDQGAGDWDGFLGSVTPPLFVRTHVCTGGLLPPRAMHPPAEACRWWCPSSCGPRPAGRCR